MTKTKLLHVDTESHRLAKMQASKEGISLQTWICKIIQESTKKEK